MLGAAPLPQSVAVIAEVIGREDALFLAGALRPCIRRPWLAPLYVPSAARLSPDHELVAVLGWATALRLCRGLGGEMMSVSKCRGLERGLRNRRIFELRREGFDAAGISAVLDIRVDTVRKVLQAGPPADPPMDVGSGVQA